jgi:hypothetical protein
MSVRRRWIEKITRGIVEGCFQAWGTSLAAATWGRPRFSTGHFFQKLCRDHDTAYLLDSKVGISYENGCLNALSSEAKAKPMNRCPYFKNHRGCEAYEMLNDNAATGVELIDTRASATATVRLAIGQIYEASQASSRPRCCS